MRTLSLTPYVIFGCLYLALLFLHARSSWRRYKAFPGVKAFQFYLLDTVAAAVGLSPTVWLVAEASKGASLYPVDAWLLAGAAGLSQLVGLFLGRIHGTVPPQNPPSEWIDALWVLGGGVLRPAAAGGVLRGLCDRLHDSGVHVLGRAGLHPAAGRLRRAGGLRSPSSQLTQWRSALSF